MFRCVRCEIARWICKSVVPSTPIAEVEVWVSSPSICSHVGGIRAGYIMWLNASIGPWLACMQQFSRQPSSKEAFAHGIRWQPCKAARPTTTVTVALV